MEVKETPFTFINAINNHEFKEVTGTYQPSLVNRFFSYFIDTIYIALEGSQTSLLQGYNQAHYDLYYSLVKRKKRFMAKWPKGLHSSEKVKALAEYYNMSMKEALIVMPAVSEDHWKEIIENEKQKKIN